MSVPRAVKPQEQLGCVFGGITPASDGAAEVPRAVRPGERVIGAPSAGLSLEELLASRAPRRFVRRGRCIAGKAETQEQAGREENGASLTVGKTWRSVAKDHSIFVQTMGSTSVIPNRIDDCKLPPSFDGRDIIELRQGRGEKVTIAPSRILRHAPRILFGREPWLDALDAAWAKPTLNVYTLVAWGGVGKTSLVAHWVSQRLAAKNWPGVERYFDWSFYSQGTGESRQTSSDLFIQEALKFFDDPDPIKGSPWERVGLLADVGVEVVEPPWRLGHHRGGGSSRPSSPMQAMGRLLLLRAEPEESLSLRRKKRWRSSRECSALTVAQSPSPGLRSRDLWRRCTPRPAF